MLFETAIELMDHVGRSGKDRKDSKNRIGLCHGCFDVIHIGHIEHLWAARSDVDVLVVSVTADAFVAKAGRPIFGEQARARVLVSVRPVDHVVITASDSAINLIDMLRPDVFFKGSDYRNADVSFQHANFRREAKLVHSYGGIVTFTDEESFSSTRTIELLKRSSG